jgi:hypothetical protein
MRAYAAAPLRARGEPKDELGLGEAAGEAFGGQIIG